MAFPFNSIDSIQPSVTPPSPNEWPNTIKTITGITNAAQAKITCPSHGFTSQDQGVTTVDILQVKGMSQINGLPGLIQQVIDSSNFTVNINSTRFSTYSSAGVISIVTGTPALEQSGSQIFNTPFQNIA